MELAFGAQMAEWSKAPGLRSGIVKMRGFETHSVHYFKINNLITNFIQFQVVK